MLPTDASASVPAHAGAQLHEPFAPHGLAMSSGDYGDVGVGGLATAGGIGFLVRKYGLTIDHVRAADLVLADGTFVRVDADNQPDCSGPSGGAGGNFGVVTALELDAYEVRDVVFSPMAFEASAEFLQRWGEVIEAAPRELTSFLTVFAQGGEPVAQLYNVYADDDADAATDALTALLGTGALLDVQAQLIPYRTIVAPHGGVHLGGQGAPASRSGLLDHVTPEAGRSLMRLVRSGEAPMMQVRSVGGAVNDLGAGATAYAHRTQNFASSAVGMSVDRLNAMGRGHVTARTRALPELRYRSAPRAPGRRVPRRDLDEAPPSEGAVWPRQRLQPELPDCDGDAQ